MTKNKTIKKNKPHEILELEKIFQITLEETEKYKVRDASFPDNSYTLNSNNKVNGICIGNSIIKDLSPFNIIIDLELLALSRGLIDDISPLAIQKKIKYLFIGGNKIKDISPILQCTKLCSLAIWDNPINNIDCLKQLYELEELFCQNTRTHNLNFISEFKKIKNLGLSQNYISDITPLINITSIERLYLQNNKIKEITVLKKLKKLKELQINNNLITEIPKEIAEKFNWLEKSINQSFFNAKIGINNNPLEFPPASVIELGSETVKNYYDSAKKYNHAPLSEGRIIVIGDGSSGKSSLIEKTLYNTFTKGREQTNGIKIEHLHLPHPEDKRDLVFHIWDFGGQEIQHAVHKFFFTEGCLYVLVLDNRKEEEPEYWLQQIESLGGNAPVLVVFNKQDENAAETADRKLLKEKYPNIIGFYNTSCQSGFGIDVFKKDLETEVVKLRTVNEQFPNNWLAIKKAIEQYTAGDNHYLTYEAYQEICKQNNAESEITQKLLLKYFNTIGAVTWFGEDTQLKFLHVLNPVWITQGVYKILTGKKTANLFGQIQISDFKELLQRIAKDDYTYEEKHYGFLLTMMEKFNLCDIRDKVHLLIPSAFAKTPRVEYREFKGTNVRTYILQFIDYLPLALIHRYITQKLPQALDNNYWYTGIVIKDTKSETFAMVHADKEAKRIYVKIKGDSQFVMWEIFRREFEIITSSYAKIAYNELVAVDENIENNVNYADLVSHIQAKRELYFHSKLKKDFNVGYLMGKFQSTEVTIEKIKKGEISLQEKDFEKPEIIPPFILQIINNNSPTVNTQINTHINIDIDIQVVNTISSTVKGDADYLLNELKKPSKELSDALKKIMEFANDAKLAQNSGDVIEKGWGRKLKSIIQTLANSGEQFKNIQDGKEALDSMFQGIGNLASQFNLKDIVDLIGNI